MYNFYKKSIHGYDAPGFLGQLFKKKMRPIRGYLRYYSEDYTPSIKSLAKYRNKQFLIKKKSKDTKNMNK